jgi:hypothetical protein
MNPGRRGRVGPIGTAQAADGRAEVAGVLGGVAQERHRRRGVPAVGITPWQLRAIREWVKEGAKDALTRGPGRPRRDPELTELEHEVDRTSKALKELAIENTLLRGKVNGV